MKGGSAKPVRLFHFPNLRIAYLGSRIYAGYASSPRNPEPYAYEGAFAARRLILAQPAADPVAPFSPAPRGGRGFPCPGRRYSGGVSLPLFGKRYGHARFRVCRS